MDPETTPTEWLRALESQLNALVKQANDLNVAGAADEREASPHGLDVYAKLMDGFKNLPK